MQTYRELFGVTEFRALFGVVCVRAGGSTVEGIALGTLIYARTGSPLFSALSMFGPSAAQVFGAATLMSWADRVRPRATIVAIGAAYSIVAVLLALPWPVWWLMAVALASGLIGSFNGGVQWGLVREVVPLDGYVLARSIFTVAVGLMQILGFGLGGVLVNIIGSRTTLLLAAAIFAASSLSARLWLRERPKRAADRASVRMTWQENRVLLSSAERRACYLMLWVPNGLIVGCEALFIPYTPHRAGVLLAAAGLGMLAGDVLVARVLRPVALGRSAAKLYLLLAAPYLLFAFRPPWPVAAVLVVIASVGYGASLLVQQQLLHSIPESLSGHALGLQSSGTLTGQALAAALAGSLAQVLSPHVVMAILAAGSIAVTLTMTRRLRGFDKETAPQLQRFG